MKKHLCSMLFLAVLLTALLPLAVRAAADWSAWETVSHAVSVSYSQLSDKSWTWKFRNDGTNSITYMKFDYTDKDGTHTDYLPYTLKPGDVHGGWSSFTASSRPTIVIKDITRK